MNTLFHRETDMESLRTQSDKLLARLYPVLDGAENGVILMSVVRLSARLLADQLMHRGRLSPRDVEECVAAYSTALKDSIKYQFAGVAQELADALIAGKEPN